MLTYSPVTSEKQAAREAFDALWSSHHPANWALPADPSAPPQEMLLERLWSREAESAEEYAGVPI